MPEGFPLEKKTGHKTWSLLFTQLPSMNLQKTTEKTHYETSQKDVKIHIYQHPPEYNKIRVILLLGAF